MESPINASCFNNIRQYMSYVMRWCCLRLGESEARPIRYPFPVIVRRSSVPDPNSEAVNDPPPENSPSVKPIRTSLKFLAAYSVAIVNGAALLYIVVRILLAGIRRFLDSP